MSNEFASANLTVGQLNALVKIVGGEEAVREILRGTIVIYKKLTNFITTTFNVMVDETKTVEEAAETGMFTWLYPGIISEHFPKPVGGVKKEREIVLFHFNIMNGFSSEEVISLMNRMGYKPATVWDLIALAVREPNLQKKYPIVALGSVCQFEGFRRVACLDNVTEGRILGLKQFDNTWNVLNRFIAVHQ